MNINELWPELAWIKDNELREATIKTWERQNIYNC